MQPQEKEQEILYEHGDLGETRFRDAEEAWFWYCRYEGLEARRSPAATRIVVRPCSLDDVYLCVVKLYLARRIGERHVRTLVKYGRRQFPPDPRVPAEELESIWWDDALDKLQALLVRKGIVLCGSSD